MIFGNKNNKIILHKKGGSVSQVRYIKGLSIKFKGKNSTIEIWEPFRFRKWFGEDRCKIRINGDNNYIRMLPTIYGIFSIQLSGIGSNNKITIGKNLYASGVTKIEFAGGSDLSFAIGKNCMFGQNVKFLLGDYHNIFDVTTNKQINIPENGITIGDNVWIARDVKILKDVSIANNSIVATGSIVTKSFDKENILIGGSPAKILKENVSWTP